MFGKLPAQGDFVSRGLDRALCDALDLWLTGEMEAAQARFGASFEQRYFAAPAWLFVDRDPMGQWSGGALCASVDAVGRKFPVMTGVPAESSNAAAGLAAGCLQSLYIAFAGGLGADELIGRELVPEPSDWVVTDSTWALIGEDGTSVSLPERFPVGVIGKMMELAA